MSLPESGEQRYNYKSDQQQQQSLIQSGVQLERSGSGWKQRTAL